MKRILMVCLGNICRSPLAAGILRKKIAEAGKNVMVESAGFEPYHVGERPDRRAITVARKNGVDISGHHARLFSVDDFDNFDMIYVMDQRNYRDVTFVARDENDKNKIDYILNLIHKFKNQTVPDPYYGNESDFELTYQLLESACDKIVAKL